MHSSTPQTLPVKEPDRVFLIEIARKILGGSNVAATTAKALTKEGLDVSRVNLLIPWASVAVEVDGFVFKKVEPDKETPENFGLFVRRRS
jgi:hypothetical protein